MADFGSSTLRVPDVSGVPRHLAIIMDGNGRWARKRFLPRVAGHKRGVDTLRRVIRACMERGIEYLTVFAFSSENWRRPPEEVSFLMNLFVAALNDEVARLHENGIRLKVVGDLDRFEPRLRELIAAGERHFCALGARKELWCWGTDTHGQLGDSAELAYRFEPVVVKTPGEVAHIALGREHSCALLASGDVRCWGNNANGALGDTVPRKFYDRPFRVPGVPTVSASSRAPR